MDVNQSHRHVQGKHVTNVLTDKRRHFEYGRLNPDTDGIRLLEIRQAESQDDPLVCKLLHVTFQERPRFDALSYRWGDEMSQMPIIVNDCQHYVRKNLWDALHYLRAQRRSTRFWIDAVCINQNDIEERNHQVGIMHHIYDRASTVIVWLGEEHGQYRNLTTPVQPCEDETPEGIAVADGSDHYPSLRSMEPNDLAGLTEQGLVKGLYGDEYWRRVWIIQEIGQANDLLVCFGTSNPMAWNDFIHLISRHNIGHDGPIRLARLRRERDNGSFNFRRLLADHREAKCHDPRDKIYGLVGLAADAHNFPMDYNKPLIVVLSDVMEFTYSKGLLPEDEIIEFGASVKYLLMGSDCSSWQRFRQPPAVGEPAVLPETRVPFAIMGTVVGQIEHVGPSTKEILTRLSAVDNWNETVQENYAQLLEQANQESRQLLRAIIRSKLTRDCFRHVSSIPWEDSYWGDSGSGTSLYLHGNFEDGTKAPVEVNRDGAPRLFQLRYDFGKNTPWKMGIASCEARKGDLVVWIPNVRQALVVRGRRSDFADHVRLNIVGTAWFSEDVARVDCNHHDRLEWFDERDAALPLHMDVITVVILLAQLDGEVTWRPFNHHSISRERPGFSSRCMAAARVALPATVAYIWLSMLEGIPKVS